jgi:speckle-type POZ protein
MTAKLFETKDFSDITIICSDKKFLAHRCILAERSSVFKAMLTTEMTEKKLSKIVIEDIDDATMQELLRFIYTREVQNLETLAPKLLYAAEKYDLYELKSICASHLTEEVSEKNVFENLVLADRHNEQQLLTVCMEFINK